MRWWLASNDTPAEVSDPRLYSNRLLGLRHPPRYPAVISLEPVNACNLKCAMCEYGFQAKRTAPVTMLDADLVEHILDQVRGRVPSIAFSGNGEPLLHPALGRMMRAAGERGFSTRLTTNGLLLREDLARDLLSSGLGELRVSVEGASTETYEAIHAGGTFERLLDRLAMVRRIKDQMRARTRIIVHTVLQKANLHEFGLHKQVFGQYADGCTITLPCTYGGVDGGYSFLPMFRPHECTIAWKTLSVVSNGLVSPCCNNHYRRSIVGDARETPVLAIWRNAEYSAFRLAHLQGRFDAIDLCRDCRMSPAAAIAEIRRRYELL